MLCAGILVPVFLFMLGKGLGKVDSLGMQQGLFKEPEGAPPAEAEAPAEPPL